MYTRQEASQIRKRFWTLFGQYMKPVPGASGQAINWLNYKTGKKNIYIRMEAERDCAAIRLELRHPDAALRQYYFEQVNNFKQLLSNDTGPEWCWPATAINTGSSAAVIVEARVEGVNVMEESGWPQIISFLKPRIIALDQFWEAIKDLLE
ncbi:MAG TPA: DUF4268 domain-containing protein [Chitinophagaceae bacterium]|nr:DUF4268 domain-containing protein [Chitinophagaceae bacterium]